MLPTDLTVSAVVEVDGRFLLVEDRSSGVVVVNLPGGHIKAGESPEQAVARVTLAQTGCAIESSGLLGVYLWIHPQTRQNLLRIVYTAELQSQDDKRTLDDAIHAVHWYTKSDLEHRRKDVRTPAVLRSLDDYLAGHRQPANLLENLMPIQHNVHEVIASAALL